MVLESHFNKFGEICLHFFRYWRAIAENVVNWLAMNI